MPSPNSRANKEADDDSMRNEPLRFLASTPLRGELLKFLENNPSTVRTLRDELDVPHSTLHRNLNKLEEQDWIEENDDRTYTLTLSGELITTEFQNLKGTADFAEKLTEFVNSVPVSELDFDASKIKDATVTVADERHPYMASRRFVSLLRRTTNVRIITPYYNPRHARTILEQVRQDELTGEVLLPADQLSTVENAPDSAWNELQETVSVSIRIVDEPLQFGFGIVGSTSIITGYRNGVVRSLLEGEYDEIENWVGNEYKRYRERSESIERH